MTEVSSTGNPDYDEVVHALEAAMELLAEANLLATHGENAPGGHETWNAWYRKNEVFLRAFSTPLGEAPEVPETTWASVRSQVKKLQGLVAPDARPYVWFWAGAIFEEGVREGLTRALQDNSQPRIERFDPPFRPSRW
jgi:hypothetical protein